MRCLSVQLIDYEVFGQRKICGLQHRLQQPILERQYCHLHPTINVSICYARTSLVFPRKLTPLPVMVRNNNIVLLGWPWLGMGCDLLTLGHNFFLWSCNNACCGNMKRTPPSIFDCVLYFGKAHYRNCGWLQGARPFQGAQRHQDLSKVLNNIKIFPRCSTTSRLLVQISKEQGLG